MTTKQLALSVALLALVPNALAGETAYKVGSGSRAQQIATVESVTDLETFTGAAALRSRCLLRLLGFLQQQAECVLNTGDCGIHGPILPDDTAAGPV